MAFAHRFWNINILNSTAVFLTTVAGWIFADFLSGRFHKYIDAYGDENTPIVGTVIKEFAHHHRRPKDALCTPLLAALWGEVRFTAPLTILLMWVPMHPLLRIFAVTALAGIALSQHSHNLAHIPLKKRSTSLKIVQVLRIFLRHRPHMIHHRPPHSEYFEPLNGVCSPILERLNDNRREECLFWYLFHAVPRTWEDPKLAPPSYLDETMHHASGMARFKFDQQFLNNSENQNHLGTQRPKERIK